MFMPSILTTSAPEADIAAVVELARRGDALVVRVDGRRADAKCVRRRRRAAAVTESLCVLLRVLAKGVRDRHIRIDEVQAVLEDAASTSKVRLRAGSGYRER